MSGTTQDEQQDKFEQFCLNLKTAIRRFESQHQISIVKKKTINQRVFSFLVTLASTIIIIIVNLFMILADKNVTRLLYMTSIFIPLTWGRYYKFKDD